MAQAPKRALLVIDVQNEYVTGNLKIEYPPLDVSLPNIVRAMDAAKAAGIPIVMVQQFFPAGFPVFARDSEGARLHASVAGKHWDHLVEKELASVLTPDTGLAAWLTKHGIDTVTVVGYMTHNCDDSTVRMLQHAGWKAELLHDAAGSLPYRNAVGEASAEEIHRVFTVVAHTAFAAVVSTDAWIAAVAAGEALEMDNVFFSNQRALGKL